jgi:signal transduction histidine kinase
VNDGQVAPWEDADALARPYRRAMRGISRALRWARGLDPFIADGLLALLLSLVALVQVYAGRPLPGYRQPGIGSVALALLDTLPLVWRRRAPLTVLGVVFVATMVGELSAVPYGNGLALLVALYTVAAGCQRRRSIPALALVTVGVLALLTAGSIYAPQQVTPDYFVSNLLVLGASWAIGDSARTRRAYTAELEDRAERLEREREAATAAAAANERARIARELHDVVAHHVSVMAVQAGAARRAMGTQPARAGAAVESIETTARLALTELRRLLGVLRREGQGDAGALTPQPGLGDLDALLEQARAAGLAVDLAVEGDQRPLPAAVDLSAYRIVQEALTNTIKHARARRVTVTIERRPAELALTVADDGRGIADQAELAAGGHGLVGMRERVALFGGRLEVGPRLGGGLRVSACLPLDPVPVRVEP